ncbi:MAG TPA: hypothetical protein VE053_06935 [Allosphingosinicella sp.]|nr:hypothetical protein [Allosphingosinicella sp.]
MADSPPLLFQKRLGGLFPANPAAEQAMAAVDGRVRVEIKSMRGNAKRNALYWSCLSVAVPMLDEKAPGLTVDLLHKVLKDRAGLVRVIELPSGEKVKDYESISFAKMTEPERAGFIDFGLKTVSSWLGVPVEDLLKEGDAA